MRPEFPRHPAAGKGLLPTPALDSASGSMSMKRQWRALGAVPLPGVPAGRIRATAAAPEAPEAWVGHAPGFLREARAAETGRPQTTGARTDR